MLAKGILAAGLLLMPFPSSSHQDLPDRPMLTLDVARQVAAAAEAEAVDNDWKVAIAVVDAAGHLVVFHRMDDAKLVATDIAMRKAKTAVYFQSETKDLEEEVHQGGRTPLLAIEGFMPLEGGVPLRVDGVMVGAVGVSGVTGQQDAQCALAGAGALGR